MSSPNVQRVYESLVAYQEGDENKLRELIHPEAVIYGAPGLVNAGTYHGYEGFRQWVSQWEEAWDGISYEFGEFTEIGDSVVFVPVHIVGRGAASGVEIDTTFGWLYAWSDGQLVRYEVHADPEDALEAGRSLAAERT
jgi:ketosteroid isomerase-like protein